LKPEIKQLDFVEAIQAAFRERAVVQTFKKGQFLRAAGEHENQLFYIEEGAVKIYYLSELGEHIIRLGYPGSMLNSLSAYLSGAISELYIEAIRETKVRVLNREQINDVMSNSSAYAKFLEALLVQQLERELDLLQDSPSQRLERVLSRSPHLFQHVPLKYIAAYLRMSPETLSRIRKS